MKHLENQTVCHNNGAWSMKSISLTFTQLLNIGERRLASGRLATYNGWLVVHDTLSDFSS